MQFKAAVAAAMILAAGAVQAAPLVFNLTTLTLDVPEVQVGDITYNLQFHYDPDGRLTITSATPVAAGFAGTYDCTYNGSDSGTFKFVMSTATGVTSSCSGSGFYSGAFLCTGQVNSAGALNTAFASTGATGVGQATATGATGTWSNTGAGGNFSCTRN